MTSYYLAQANYARAVAPLDDPVMEEFMRQIDHLNRLADSARDFVWRLKTEEGNATSIRAFEDERILFNMSVWKSIDALFEYTYYSGHAEAFRRRHQWFEKSETPVLALWWIPADHIPTVEETRERLEHLHAHGATPYAFSFKQRYTVEEFLSSQYAPREV
jgi:hypothetical protein